MQEIDLATSEVPEFAKLIYLLVSPSLSLLDAEQKHSLIDVLGNKLNENFGEFPILRKV